MGGQFVNLSLEKLMGGQIEGSHNKSGALFHALRRSILLREIQPDDPMTESDIGRQYGCSQGTVREALMRLQEEGLVKRRGYRGTTASRSTVDEVVQMVEIRIKLETEAIERTVEIISDSKINELAEYLNRMEQAAQQTDHYELSEMDRKFHLTLFHCSGLAALEPILNRCMLHMHLHTFGNGAPKAKPGFVTAAHQPILDALQDRDPPAAVQALSDHIHATISNGAPPLKTALDAHQKP
ncbi:MAG: GntR family transcriptional regulator [Paracoccaceae bacterium]